MYSPGWRSASIVDVAAALDDLALLVDAVALERRCCAAIEDSFSESIVSWPAGASALPNW